MQRSQRGAAIGASPDPGGGSSHALEDDRGIGRDDRHRRRLFEWRRCGHHGTDHGRVERAVDQEAQKKAWLDPYTALTGVQFVTDENSSNATIKSQVEAGQVTWDVVDV